MGNDKIDETNAVSWASEVIADGTGKWCGNALRFATRPEAESYVQDLFWRWVMVTDTRVIPSSDAVNYCWVTGRGLVRIEDESSITVATAVAS